MITWNGDRVTIQGPRSKITLDMGLQIEMEWYDMKSAPAQELIREYEMGLDYLQSRDITQETFMQLEGLQLGLRKFRLWNNM